LSKEIWLGPVLGNNRERLLARCAEYVKTGETDRLLYIAASHPLLDLVTEKLLDGKQANGVWGEFPVYLFRGLVRRVLLSAIDETTGQPLTPRVAIDHEELPLRRSLISQIIKQLSLAGKLRAIRPLANREGCVNTIASLIGELQRAGKTPQEFQLAIDARAGEYGDADQEAEQPKLVGQPRAQIDFDREVALIYASYAEALDRFSLTDDDADQLRALQVLRGEVAGKRISLPWLDNIELLVLDGFFDFTPVQGEILKYLIPAVPNAIVNINGDSRNEDIFRPFQSTIEHLESIADFTTEVNEEGSAVSAELAPLRVGLFNVAQVGNLRPTKEPVADPGRVMISQTPDQQFFNPSPSPQAERGLGGKVVARRLPTPDPSPQAGRGDVPTQVNNLRHIKLIECSDREVEIRSIAKEIKRLVLTEGYRLSDIALVVRERAAYADSILRVCADESIPANLERRVEAVDVPAIRASGKLFQLLRDTTREHIRNPKASELAHLVKTEYFRVSPDDLPELTKNFEAKYSSLLVDDRSASTSLPDWKRAELGIGQWLPDALENAIAYVGSELRVTAWIERAQRLIDMFPSPEAARSLIAGSENEDPAAVAEDEAPPDDPGARDRRKKPAPIHPAAIAWTVILMEHMQTLLASLPEEGEPEELRGALMLLLERLEFSNQARRLFQQAEATADVPQATLDVRGLESLRRALAAAVRGFHYAHQVTAEARPSGRANTEPLLTRGPGPRITLSGFVDEVERSLRSQVLSVGAANRDGLRVLEATDVRGLRFRAIFIAGMIEGGFPLRTSRDWLYPHEERVRLQKHGIYLEDISTDTLLKEEHYFYQAACRATERLYLTRPLATSAVSETVASYYIEELKRSIHPATVETEQIRGDLDTQELTQASTASELSTFLVRQSEHRNQAGAGKRSLSQAQLKDLLMRAEKDNYISHSALRRVEIERQRNSAWFGPFDGEITNADLRAMLARHFGPEHVYSASGLSAYGNCSFRFFAARVLRLEPRSEAALDLQAIDAGKLLHDILRRFFERHRHQYLPAVDREQLRHEMAKVADDVFKEHERMVPPLNQRIWKIDCEIRKLILDQVLLYELRLQEKTNDRGIRPGYFELAFGRASQASDPSSSPDYLRLPRAGADGSETALLQGQIDRVDVNDRERVAVAYDYKLSQGARLEDIETGRQVQIPIYLAALEQLFLPGYALAGGGYYRLRGSASRLNQGLYRLAFADCTNVTGSKTKLSDDEWERIRNEVRTRVWEFIDGMRRGHFKVKPSLGKLTCKFCDYSAVCRYDTYRINGKR
jgi:ATP-dependent helicase/DNAse subunit B